MFELTFAQPDHQACADHRRARQAADKVQPAQHRAGEMAHVQTVETATNDRWQRWLGTGPQQLASGAAKRQRTARRMHYAVGAGAEHIDRGVDIARVVDRHTPYMTTCPLLPRLLVHRHQRQQFARLAEGRRIVSSGEQLTEKRPAVVTVGRHDGRGHDHAHENHQAAVGDHQVKRQHQHTHRVMPVQPGALAFARAEGEEVLEDFLVGDDARDQRDEHHHGSDGRQPAAPRVRHLQLEVEAIEELTALAFPGLHRLAGDGVEDFLDESAALAGLDLVLPHHRQAGVAAVRQGNEPACGGRRLLLQIVLRDGEAALIVQGMGLHFGLHPVGYFIFEIGQGAGQENREQQPAEDQACPGVQPGHGLAKALFHVRAIQKPMPARVAKSALGTITPAQARHAVRQAKHQSTASR